MLLSKEKSWQFVQLFVPILFPNPFHFPIECYFCQCASREADGTQGEMATCLFSVNIPRIFFL